MDLTVTRYKPIEVFILGEVSKPGAYTVTSNATLFNVLYAVGGPTTEDLFEMFESFVTVVFYNPLIFMIYF